MAWRGRRRGQKGVVYGGRGRGAVGAVSSTIEFALINHTLAPRDTYKNQNTEIVCTQLYFFVLSLSRSERVRGRRFHGMENNID